MESQSEGVATPNAAGALRPMIVTPGDAETIRPFGIDMKVMLGGEHTGGTFSAVVAEIKPGEGPPRICTATGKSISTSWRAPIPFGKRQRSDDRSGNLGFRPTRHRPYLQKRLDQHRQTAGMDHPGR